MFRAPSMLQPPAGKTRMHSYGHLQLTLMVSIIDLLFVTPQKKSCSMGDF